MDVLIIGIVKVIIGPILGGIGGLILLGILQTLNKKAVQASDTASSDETVLGVVQQDNKLREQIDEQVTTQPTPPSSTVQTTTVTTQSGSIPTKTDPNSVGVLHNIGNDSLLNQWSTPT